MFITIEKHALAISIRQQLVPGTQEYTAITLVRVLWLIAPRPAPFMILFWFLVVVLRVHTIKYLRSFRTPRTV